MYYFCILNYTLTVWPQAVRKYHIKAYALVLYLMWNIRNHNKKIDVATEVASQNTIHQFFGSFILLDQQREKVIYTNAGLIENIIQGSQEGAKKGKNDAINRG